MNNEKNLGDLLTEIMETRGISLDRLASLTNINKRYLAHLLVNDFKSVPASPYIRGYLSKIAEVMETDPKPLQEAYLTGLEKLENKDAPPQNKFALSSPKRNLIIAGLIVVVVFIFLWVKWDSLMGIPKIEVNIPEKVGSEDYIETRSSIYVVEGAVDPKDSLFINDEPISVDSLGRFIKEVSLNEGLNILNLKAKRFLGEETTISRKIFYILPEKELLEDTSSELIEISIPQKKNTKQTN